MNDKNEESIDFGYQKVARNQKKNLVADVFQSVAAKYDVMNDLMSLGIHRLWKRYTIDCSGARRGMKVLDIAGGTGDLTAQFSRRVGAAEELPFDDNTFDVITIAFGLRNVTDKDKALRSMLRVLKPGGRLLILEFSKPVSATLNQVYDFYSFNILPKMGQVVANDSDSYQYLAESIRMHPDQETLKSMMEAAGYEKVDYQNMTGGVVALHRGYKF